MRSTGHDRFPNSNPHFRQRPWSLKKTSALRRSQSGGYVGWLRNVGSSEALQRFSSSAHAWASRRSRRFLLRSRKWLNNAHAAIAPPTIAKNLSSNGIASQFARRQLEFRGKRNWMLPPAYSPSSGLPGGVCRLRGLRGLSGGVSPRPKHPRQDSPDTPAPSPGTPGTLPPVGGGETRTLAGPIAWQFTELRKLPGYAGGGWRRHTWSKNEGLLSGYEELQPRSAGLRPKVPFCEGVTGAALQVPFKMLGLFD